MPVFSEEHLKRLIALCLILSLLSTSLIYLTSCATPEETPSAPEEGGEQPPKPQPTIFSPEYKDYERGSVDFSLITYTRPNISAIIAEANEITDAIEGGTLSYTTHLFCLFRRTGSLHIPLACGALCTC